MMMRITCMLIAMQLMIVSGVHIYIYVYTVLL
jgi:hypothetical protein